MKQIKLITNIGMGISASYLLFRLIIWLIHAQPAEATRLLSILNQLTVVALIIIVASYITSKVFVKKNDETTKVVRKISQIIFIVIGIFVLFSIFTLVWAIQSETLFDGWEF
jgi:hypothetical protein